MVNRKALGRGLSALLPDEPTESVSAGQLHQIDVKSISPNPFQPRLTFDSEKLEELMRSISENGVVQPITVRRIQDGYQLIAGERRFRAVTELGVDKIPAYVLEVQTDQEMLELSIVENIHREDLNSIEVAKGYKRLIDECGLTQDQVAQKVCKDRTTVTNFLRLLKLPAQIQASVQEGALTMGHARALLTLQDVGQQLALWKKIVQNDLSVRSVEQAVKNKKKEKSPKKPDAKSYYLEDVENRMRVKLATKVSVNMKGKGGSVAIDFYSEDDLERIVSMICDE